MIVTTMCCLILSIDAGPVELAIIRRLGATPAGNTDPGNPHPDSVPTVALPLRSIEPFDLVPHVDGLSFVVNDGKEDTSRVLLFRGTVARSLASWSPVNGTSQHPKKKTATLPAGVLAVRAGTRRLDRSQRIVAGVSFVAGVTVSTTTVCLLVRLHRRRHCCCWEGGGEGGGEGNDGVGDVTKPDDVREEAAS